MRKFICGLLAMGMIVIAGNVFAGEKANVVVTTSPNQAIVSGITSFTGTTSVSSGLGTATNVIAFIDSGSFANTKAYVVGTSSGGDVVLKVYGTDTTTLATGATVVHWLAIGTP